MSRHMNEIPSNGFIRSVENIARSNEANKAEPDVGLLRGRLYSRNSVKYRVLSKLASLIGIRESKEMRDVKLVAKFAQLQTSGRLSVNAHQLVDKIYHVSKNNLLHNDAKLPAIIGMTKIYNGLSERDPDKARFKEKIVDSYLKLLEEDGLEDHQIVNLLITAHLAIPKEFTPEVYTRAVPFLRQALIKSENPSGLLIDLMNQFRINFENQSDLGICFNLLKDNPKKEEVLMNLSTGWKQIFTSMTAGDAPLETQEDLQLALKAVGPTLDIMLNKKTESWQKSINEVRLKVSNQAMPVETEYEQGRNSLKESMEEVFKDDVTKFQYKESVMQDSLDQDHTENYLVFTKVPNSQTLSFQFHSSPL